MGTIHCIHSSRRDILISKVIIRPLVPMDGSHPTGWQNKSNTHLDFRFWVTLGDFLLLSFCQNIFKSLKCEIRKNNHTCIPGADYNSRCPRRRLHRLDGLHGKFRVVSVVDARYSRGRSFVRHFIFCAGGVSQPRWAAGGLFKKCLIATYICTVYNFIVFIIFYLNLRILVCHFLYFFSLIIWCNFTSFSVAFALP